MSNLSTKVGGGRGGRDPHTPAAPAGVPEGASTQAKASFRPRTKQNTINGIRFLRAEDVCLIFTYPWLYLTKAFYFQIDQAVAILEPIRRRMSLSMRVILANVFIVSDLAYPCRHF